MTAIIALLHRHWNEHRLEISAGRIGGKGVIQVAKQQGKLISTWVQSNPSPGA